MPRYVVCLKEKENRTFWQISTRVVDVFRPWQKTPTYLSIAMPWQNENETYIGKKEVRE